VRYSIVSEATFVYCEKMDKKEALLFGEKKNTFEATAWLDKHYLDSAAINPTVEKWFAKFQRGENNFELS
jgi:hypothetical protein